LVGWQVPHLFSTSPLGLFLPLSSRRLLSLFGGVWDSWRFLFSVPPSTTCPPPEAPSPGQEQLWHVQTGNRHPGEGLIALLRFFTGVWQDLDEHDQDCLGRGRGSGKGMGGMETDLSSTPSPPRGRLSKNGWPPEQERGWKKKKGGRRKTIPPGPAPSPPSPAHAFGLFPPIPAPSPISCALPDLDFLAFF